MLKMASVFFAGSYSLGILFGAADHVIDRFALNLSLGPTLVQGLVQSLDWPLRILG